MLDAEELRILHESARIFEKEFERVQKVFKRLPDVARIVTAAGGHLSELGTQQTAIQIEISRLLAMRATINEDISKLNERLFVLGKQVAETSGDVNMKCQAALAAGAKRLAEIQANNEKAIKKSDDDAMEKMQLAEEAVADCKRDTDKRMDEMRSVLAVLSQEKNQAEARLRTIQSKIEEIKTRL
jgi:chromosome segregation ATPase